MVWHLKITSLQEKQTRDNCAQQWNLRNVDEKLMCRTESNRRHQLIQFYLLLHREQAPQSEADLWITVVLPGEKPPWKEVGISVCANSVTSYWQMYRGEIASPQKTQDNIHTGRETAWTLKGLCEVIRRHPVKCNRTLGWVGGTDTGSPLSEGTVGKETPKKKKKRHRHCGGLKEMPPTGPQALLGDETLMQ